MIVGAALSCGGRHVSLVRKQRDGFWDFLVLDLSPQSGSAHLQSESPLVS